MIEFNEISKRMEYLKKLIDEKELALENVPDGILRGFAHRGRWQYYLRKDKNDKNGMYITNANQQLAQAVGQKEYDQLVLQQARQEYNKLNQLVNFYTRTRYKTAEGV